MDLKKAAKLFATKFACGSSVTKNPQGTDDIIVQGDVQDDIYDLILKTWKEVRWQKPTLHGQIARQYSMLGSGRTN